MFLECRGIVEGERSDKGQDAPAALSHGATSRQEESEATGARSTIYHAMGRDDSRRSESRAEHVDGGLGYHHYHYYHEHQQRGTAERAGASTMQPRTGRSLKYYRVTNESIHGTQ